jgi:hypothetical protein
VGILDSVGNIVVWVDDLIGNTSTLAKRRGYDRLSAAESSGDVMLSEFAAAAGNHWDEKRLKPGRWERIICLANIKGYAGDKIGFRVIREGDADKAWEHRLILLPEPRIGYSRDEVIKNLSATIISKPERFAQHFEVAPVAVGISGDYNALRNLKKTWDRTGAQMTIRTEPAKR